MRFEQVLRDSFRAHERKTLAVVCFALGSWVGGMFTASCLRWIAAKGYPLLIVTPGNKIDEILRVVKRLAPDFEQTVLLGYPPFLKDVVDAGRGEKIDWGKFNVRLVMAGEVFSEDLARPGAGAPGQDEGLQQHRLALRHRRCRRARQRDAAVGGDPPLPEREARGGHGAVRRGAAADARASTIRPSRYFEAVEGGTLAFSGDNGAPLIRYHIADQGGIYSFEAMRAQAGATISSMRSSQWRRPACARGGSPSSMCSAGRISRVSFFGANIFPETISLALEKPSLSRWTTGKFVMEVKEGLAERPRFTVAVELADKEAPIRPGSSWRSARSSTRC